MKSTLSIICAFTISQYCAGYLTEKPAFVLTCYKTDPNFDNCSRDSVQGIFDKLRTGFEEVGILPLDPLNVTEIRILQGSNGPVTVNASLSGVKITGLGSAHILSNRVNFKTYTFETRMMIPDLRIEGNYNLNGRILLLPLIGKGDAWFEPHNMLVDSITNIDLITENEQKFFKVKKVKVDFDIETLKLRLNHLYNGLTALEESTNKYLNMNWRPAADSLKPVMAKTVENILYTILKKLFDVVPANYFIGDVGE